MKSRTYVKPCILMSVISLSFECRYSLSSAEHDQVLCLSSERLILDAQLGPRNLGFSVSSSSFAQRRTADLQPKLLVLGNWPKGSFLLMALAEGRHKTFGAVAVLDQSRKARRARGVAVEV